MSDAVSLMAPSFIALSVFAVIGVTALAGVARQLVFLTANLVFLCGLLLPGPAAASIAAFTLAGYALVWLVLSRPVWSFRIGLPVYVLLFVYANNYDFLGLVLPENVLTSALRAVGLSFLFFKIVHVVIEAHSGTLGRVDLLTYLNYCFNFTTFMMGPIQRFQDYRDQWHLDKQAIPLTWEAHLDAAVRILLGLLKVYVLAEWFRPMATAGAETLLGLSPLKVLICLYAFYFFLYLNFSGYCDVMIGIGSLLGVRPPENFDRPYLATNISDFWQRQHRSLTLWLTDYVFSPAFKRLLSGQTLGRHPLLAMNLCLLLTMLVSGLWHGTTAGFLVFGLLHGAFLVAYHSWDALLKSVLGRQRLRRWRAHILGRLVGMALTFHAAAAAFVFFRMDVASGTQVLAKLVVG